MPIAYRFQNRVNSNGKHGKLWTEAHNTQTHKRGVELSDTKYHIIGTRSAYNIALKTKFRFLY